MVLGKETNLVKQRLLGAGFAVRRYGGGCRNAYPGGHRARMQHRHGVSPSSGTRVSQLWDPDDEFKKFSSSATLNIL